MTDCKGLFYRGYSSTFESGGRIARHEGLRPLKRMSCPGCDTCNWYREFMAEVLDGGNVYLPKDIISGATYKLYSWDNSEDRDGGIGFERIP